MWLCMAFYCTSCVKFIQHFTSFLCLVSVCCHFCSTAFNTIALKKKKKIHTDWKKKQKTMRFLQNIAHAMIPIKDGLSRTPSMSRRRDRKTVTRTVLCRITVLNTARHGGKDVHRRHWTDISTEAVFRVRQN